MKSDLRQLSIIGKIVWQTLTWYPNSQKQDNIETHVGIHILTPLTPKNQRSFMYNPVLKKKLSNQTFEQYLSCKNLITGGPSQNMTTKTKELKLTNWTNWDAHFCMPSCCEPHIVDPKGEYFIRLAEMHYDLVEPLFPQRLQTIEKD